MKNKTEFENEKKQILESIFTDDFFEDIKKQIKNTDWEKLKKEAKEKIEREKSDKERKKEETNKILYGIFNGTIKIR